ncbi:MULTISPECIES: hypothetical protein [Stenotrophomonas]|uniref:hypothetical protein n=1 Tax=Stenotrophomonas TaxID=40323 RepID=UPI0017837860|nr:MULTISPECIES: hypothetical protein [Stenotrophomonas]MCF3474629.1 hypothetical protein [Stenotrophomonas maltophilia]
MTTDDSSALPTDGTSSIAGLASETRDRMVRSNRLQAFGAVLGVTVGLSIGVISGFAADLFSIKSSLLTFVGIVIAGASTAAGISLYLDGRLSLAKVETGRVSSLDTLARQELLLAVENVKSAAARLSEATATQTGSADGETDARLLASRAVFQEARSRLSKRAADLERRATVNLIIGTSTSVAAVVMLVAFAFTPIALVDISWQQILSYYLPKFGVVVMLEVLAFFFLRLYKATLSDSRLLDGDLDAFALKEGALLTAWSDAAENRLELAKMLVAPTDGCSDRSDDATAPLDPKLIAEMASAIAKVVRG